MLHNNPLSTLHYSLFAVFLLSFGCGRAEYERRLEERLTNLRRESRFNELYAAQAVPNTPVSVRLPQMFKDQPLVEGGQLNGKPIDKRRLTPTLFPLPWLKLTYEGFVDGDGGVRLPYYCYIAAVDMKAAQIKNPAETILAALKSKPEFKMTENWTDFNGETPEGRGVPWKKLRFASDQMFVNIKGGQEEFVQSPGVMELYLREEGNWCVLIGWRMPAAIEQKVDLSKWTPLVTGCTTIKQTEK